MKTKLILTGSVVLALSACGGSNSDNAFVTSVGLLELELPDAETRASFPTAVNNTLDDLVDINENFDTTSDLPTGSAEYSGSYAAEVSSEDEVGAYIVGDLDLVADFDPGALSITGNVTDLNVTDGDGNALTSSGTLDFVADIGANSTASISGTIIGTVDLEGENYDVGSTVDGVFAGDNAEKGIGELEGTVTNPDGSTDDLFGIVVLEQ